MKLSRLSMLASVAMMLPMAAIAQEAAKISPFTGTLAITSDYMFRGVTQSDENPALQGNVDWNHDYANGLSSKLGVWASNVDFNDGDEASSEFDLYASLNKNLGKADVGASVTYYAYPGADSNLDYNYFEVAALAAYDFDVASVNASVAYSPEFFLDSGDAYYTKLGASVPLPCKFTLDGHVGYQFVDKNTKFGLPDYSDWALGVGYNLEGFDLKAEYVDTNLSKSDCKDGCEARAVFTVSRSF
jgi:uncharacterized protein (TIGR02001 family)